jgi:hypothetical protein
MSYRTLRFQSSRFNRSRPPLAAGVPSPYGEDLAEWIRAQLQVAGWHLSQPAPVDGVWRLECCRGETRRRLLVGFDAKSGWRVSIAAPRSLFATILGHPGHADAEIVDILQAAVLRDPAICEVRWSDTDRAGRKLAVSEVG